MRRIAGRGGSHLASVPDSPGYKVSLFCRIVGAINVHNYSPAHIVIELGLDLPDEREERTMIVNSSGQIMVKTVHDHERGPEIGLA